MSLVWKVIGVKSAALPFTQHVIAFSNISLCGAVMLHVSHIA